MPIGISISQLDNLTDKPLWKPIAEVKIATLPESAPAASRGESYCTLPVGLQAVWLPIRATATDAPAADLSNLPLVDPAEAERFVTAKRSEEHAAGRHLLAHLLQQSGIDPHQLSIARDEYRKPSLIHSRTTRSDPVQSQWRLGQPSPIKAQSTDAAANRLPSFSISHSGGFAAVLLAPSGMQVGFDIEPLDRPRIREILPLMAAGAELQHLESCWDADPTTASELTTEVWVAKEAIQKAAGVGMGLAPQSFSILQPSEFASAGCDKYSSIEQPFSSSSGEQSPVYLKQRQLSVDGREFQLWLWRTEMQNRPVSVGLAIMKTD